ncbi:YciI family protein [Paenibacillus periandrae]|uniref:YciI family protein n=1 Tax=Paenibacillus periandrae TaxID=1761741 RepID=UPI001F0980C9|nr:YciI family protein [Paenibacillus periandrae]
MRYFIVFAKLLKPEIAPTVAPAHMAYMIALREAGTVIAHGRLLDGWGGVAVYRAESINEVQELVNKDPFIVEGIRSAEVHEWDLKLASGVTIA